MPVTVLRYIYICAFTLNIAKIMQFSFLLHFSYIKNYACILDMHTHAYTCIHIHDIHMLTHTLWGHSSTPLATLSDEKQAPLCLLPGRRPCVSETFRPSCFLLCLWVGSCMNPISHRRSHYRAVILTACTAIYLLSASNLG